MLSVHVHVQVKRGFEKAFLQATLANARQSRAEPGIARFEVGQSREDPQHFLLVEVYRAPEAPQQHKETAHYALWRDTVAPMMAEPRQSSKFDMLFPGEEDW